MGRIIKPRTYANKLTEGTDRHSLAVHIGQQLLKLRQKCQVTMRDVADGTGLSNAFVCQIENGQSMPTAATLWKLHRFFECPVNLFFDGYEG